MKQKTKHRVEVLLPNGSVFCIIETFSLTAMRKAIAAEIVEAITLDVGELTVKCSKIDAERSDTWKTIL